MTIVAIDLSEEITVAVIAVGGTALGAIIQLRAAVAQGRMEQGRAAQQRFAAWQVHKREMHAELVSSARRWCQHPDDNDLLEEFRTQRDRALFVANSEVRSWLNSFEPRAVTDEIGWSEIIEKLSADARMTGSAS